MCLFLTNVNSADNLKKPTNRHSDAHTVLFWFIIDDVDRVYDGHGKKYQRQSVLDKVYELWQYTLCKWRQYFFTSLHLQLAGMRN
jgi:hypothetical protein